MKRVSFIFAFTMVTLVGCSDETNKDLAAWTPGGKAMKTEISELQDENTGLKTEVETLSSQTAASQQQNAQLQTELANRDKELADLQKKKAEVKAAKLKEVTRQAQAVRITVPGDNLFSSGAVTLKAGAKTTLSKVAATLKRSYPGADITVEGYTDTDPIRKSKWKSNLALSQARANSVRAYLVSRGINSAKIRAVGMGAARPKATKSASRRVELVVVPAV